MSTQTIEVDFDRIALVTASDWNHNSYYDDYLLQHLPKNCDEALEIGCGMGAFSRRLAKRSRRVVALDLSSQMIRIARERSQEFSNIDFQVADVMTWDFPEESFDCVASIATLHHLPLAEMLLRMKGSLKRRGTLLVLDLVQPEGALDNLSNFIALPVSIGIRALRTGRLRPRREVRQAWNEHGRHDIYSTFTDVKELCAEILPGAKLCKHLLWRYSIVWEKP